MLVVSFKLHRGGVPALKEFKSLGTIVLVVERGSALGFGVVAQDDVAAHVVVDQSWLLVAVAAGLVEGRAGTFIERFRVILPNSILVLPGTTNRSIE